MFLGVIFDQGLIWAAVIDNIIDRCKVRLNFIRAIAESTSGASRSIFLIIYMALVRSVINYGCMAYDSAAAMKKEKLNRLHGEAMRICCGSLPGTVKASLQVECGQPTLSLRRRCLQADYAVRIPSDRGHPTASIMKNCLKNIYATYQPGRYPFLPTYPKYFWKQPSLSSCLRRRC